ncbi:MAG: hypothetical protein HRU22_06690 [Gammaproteobacteria bacterium]|nr:hypothetical protein [Gammaproteobacteria bacterium]
MSIKSGDNSGFSLVEFMIAMALSLGTMMMMFSIYITSFSVDNKSIKYSRLTDEIANISAIISDDLKRAGFVSNAEQLVTTPNTAINLSRCANAAQGCSDLAFRSLVIAKFGNEDPNSCITFAYDHDNDGRYNFGNNSDAMGYRLKNKAIEVRQLAKTCQQGYWRKLTDPDFVIISELTFKACGQADDTNAKCQLFTFPPQAANSDRFKVEFSFRATLTSDPSVSQTTNQSVVVKNASYH